MREHSRWGPPDGHSNLYVIGVQKFRFQNHQRKSTFFIVRMVGDQNGPSIFLSFKYVNKQDALIPNVASKVVDGH